MRAGGIPSGAVPSWTRRASCWRTSPACCRKRSASLRKLDVKILDPRIRQMLPQYGTPGAAGLDLRAWLDAPLALAPGESKLVSAGIAIHIGDAGYAAVILP